MTRQIRTERVTSPRLRPHELGIRSFGRISFDGKVHYPKALGDGYQRQTKEIQERADQVLTIVDEKYKPHANAPAHEQEAYALGRGALETFLTAFSVPRPTNGEAPMQLSMFEWANTNGFHAEVDAIGNVAVVIPGRKNGKEVNLSDPSQIGDVVVLHHHLDKVAIAKEGSGEYPDTEPVKVEVRAGDTDGNVWIQAKNGLATLGADNGAGGSIAWKMAEYYAHSTEDHPTLVVLATVGEEGATDGAQNISFVENGIVDNALQHVKYVINNDHESPEPDPEIITGSYGLELFETKYNPTSEPVDLEKYDLLEIGIAGLEGGHSGLYPDRASAGAILIKHLQETLQNPSKLEWRLCSFNGGEKHNQVAQHARAVIAIPKGTSLEAIEQLKATPNPINLSPKDNLTYEVRSPHALPSEMLSRESTEDVFGLLSDYVGLQGVVDDGWVDYHPTESTTQRVYTRSFNIGEVVVTPQSVYFNSSSRIGLPVSPDRVSEFGIYQKNLERSIAAHGHGKAELTLGEVLPTWKLNDDLLPRIAEQAYDVMPERPEEFPHLGVKIVTAGLEVAFFQERFPTAQQLVFAMNITNIHNPGEALNVSSFLTNAALMRRFLRSLFDQMEESDASTIVSGDKIQ